MANYTLSADTDLSTIPGLASGWEIDLGGHVLSVSNDMGAHAGLKASGTGTIRLLDGGNVDFSGSVPPSTVTIEGGTDANPLPSHGGYGYPMRASASIKLLGESSVKTTYAGKIVSHCQNNKARKQFAKIVSSTATELVFDRDMELQVGDAIIAYPIPSQNKDPEWESCTVSSYDAQSKTATTTSRTYSPATNSICLLLTCGFSVVLSGNNGYCCLSCEISGDEIGLFFGANANAVNVPAVSGRVSLGRLVIFQCWASEFCGFGVSGICAEQYVSNCCQAGGAFNQTGNMFFKTPSTVSFGEAYCPSLNVGWGNYFRSLNNGILIGAGMYVGGGDLSLLPLRPYGTMEVVDCGLPSPLNETLADTAELVIRTTSPETCVIHRACGIATLVRKGDVDVVMAQAPVASAYQLAPTGEDAVWHDQAVTVEAGARLTVAWRAFCSIGDVCGVQILADSPLFGQVAVPMGTADVLAEYTESSPPLGVWGPSRLLSWRNTSAQPVRVWVRGWGKGGIVYSSCQIVKGGAL